MEEEFFQFAYKQYYRELDETDNIYQRANITIIVLSMLAAANWKLFNSHLFSQCSLNTLVWLFTLGAFVLIGIGGLTLFLSILPRRNYKTLSDMNAWDEWRRSYEEYRASQANENEAASSSEAFYQAITERIVEAQPENARINEKRRQYFHWSVICAGAAALLILLEVLFYIFAKFPTG